VHVHLCTYIRAATDVCTATGRVVDRVFNAFARRRKYLVDREDAERFQTMCTSHDTLYFSEWSGLGRQVRRRNGYRPSRVRFFGRHFQTIQRPGERFRNVCLLRCVNPIYSIELAADPEATSFEYVSSVSSAVTP